MSLGHFSVSLSVKDLAASRAFYEALGFEMFDGLMEENWAMMRCGDATIGLFEGMFEQNMLTFHPPELDSLRTRLEAAGMAPVDMVEDADAGFAYINLRDPDGNQILVDRLAT